MVNLKFISIVLLCEAMLMCQSKKMRWKGPGPSDRNNLTVTEIADTYVYNLYLPGILFALGMFILSSILSIAACTLCQYVPKFEPKCRSDEFPCECMFAWLLCPNPPEEEAEGADINADKKRLLAISLTKDRLRALGDVAPSTEDRAIIVKGGALQDYNLMEDETFHATNTKALNEEDAQQRMRIKRVNSTVRSMRESMREG